MYFNTAHSIMKHTCTLLLVELIGYLTSLLNSQGLMSDGLGTRQRDEG